MSEKLSAKQYAEQLLYKPEYAADKQPDVKEKAAAFADLYDPDTSIRFGCYYLHLCLERYNGDVATAAAAYHSGWGTVDNLLRMEEHSADGQTLQGFPYSQMNHYVNKITSCYGAYQRIYAGN